MWNATTAGAAACHLNVFLAIRLNYGDVQKEHQPACGGRGGVVLGLRERVRMMVSVAACTPTGSGGGETYSQLHYA